MGKFKSSRPFLRGLLLSLVYIYVGFSIFANASDDDVFAKPMEPAGLRRRRLATPLMALGLGLIGLGGTSYTRLEYNGFNQAAKRLVSRFKMAPVSWSMYLKSIPLAHEREYSELQIVADGLDGKYESRSRNSRPESSSRRPFVYVFNQPSSKFLSLISAPERLTRRGVVVKGHVVEDDDNLSLTIAEAYIHQKIVPKSRFFLQLLGVFRSPATNYIYMVLPRACCDVSQYFRISPKTINVKLAAAEMIESLSILHENGYIHRDLKPRNYFVGFNGHILLSDFESIWPTGLISRQDEHIFTRGYQSPELKVVDANVRVSEKSDIYALGITLADLYMRVQKYQAIPDSRALVELIYHMLDSEIDRRYSMDQVKADAYFRGVDWRKVRNFQYGSPFPDTAVVSKYYENFHSGSAFRLRKLPE